MKEQRRKCNRSSFNLVSDEKQDCNAVHTIQPHWQSSLEVCRVNIYWTLSRTTYIEPCQGQHTLNPVKDNSYWTLSRTTVIEPCQGQHLLNPVKDNIYWTLSRTTFIEPCQGQHLLNPVNDTNNIPVVVQECEIQLFRYRRLYISTIYNDMLVAKGLKAYYHKKAM